MASVWVLRASGGEYDSAWETILGIYASEEDAMAAQIRYEQKELARINENIERICVHCNWYDEFHVGGKYYIPKSNNCLNFVAKKPLTKLDRGDEVWYTEEEVGRDEF